VNPNSFVAENTDDLELLKKLMKKPKLAWPTVTLLVAAWLGDVFQRGRILYGFPRGSRSDP